MKKLLVVLILLAGFFAVVPGAAYWLGMKNMDAKPVPPQDKFFTEAQAKEVWVERNEYPPIYMQAITPWHFYHLIWCSRNDAEIEDFLSCGDEYPGLQAAAYIAKRHLVDHAEKRGLLWRYMSRTALAIWITRHWSEDEVIAELLRIRTLPPI
jgi:hypothetical protein